MLQYSDLAAEISKPEYAGMSDQQIADALNAPTVTVWNDVNTGDIQGYFIINGVMNRYKEFATNPPAGTSEELLVSVRDLLDAFNSTHVTTFRFSNQVFRDTLLQRIGMHIQVGLLTPDDAAYVQSLTQTKISRAQEMGWPVIGGGDIERARTA